VAVVHLFSAKQDGFRRLETKQADVVYEVGLRRCHEKEKETDERIMVLYAVWTPWPRDRRIGVEWDPSDGRGCCCSFSWRTTIVKHELGLRFECPVVRS
jgi:hypothetical protein